MLGIKPFKQVGKRMNKSIKIERNKYQAPRPKRRFAINVSDSLCIVNHKNRWVVAFCHDEKWNRTFYGNQTLNRSDAIKLIGFLVDYINLVKPSEASALHASIKAKTNGITRSANELAGMILRDEL